MTRLERVIKAFNDYDEFVYKYTLIGMFETRGMDCTRLEEYEALENIRNDVSVLIGELKRYGCRRDEKYLKSLFY